MTFIKGQKAWNKGRKGDIFGTRKDIIGKRFGKLVAIKFHSRVIRNSGGFRYKWFFKCDCGSETIADRNSVVNGFTTSCGCRLKEIHNNIGNKFKTHGMRKTRFYNIYTNTISRCQYKFNNRYSIYGGRGIKCFWNSFEEFRDDMYESYLIHIKEFGERNTTIDRIDNNGNYCKENCQWATYKQQARNRSKNRLITFNNETLCLAEWAEKTGIKEFNLRTRIDKLHWPIEKVFNTPIK